MIDTKKMRETFACLTSRVSSHYDGCEYVHPYCAIQELCREVEELEEMLIGKKAWSDWNEIRGDLQDKNLVLYLLSQRVASQRKELARLNRDSDRLRREVERLRKGHEFAEAVSAVDYTMTDEEMMAMHTALLNSGERVYSPVSSSWYAATQNDSYYVVSGEPPAPNDDYPDHEANRVVICKCYRLEDAETIASLREEVETLRRSHESLAKRNYLAVHTLNESYDEGSPQAMALAMAILDGDSNAIADAEQNMQKRQERAAAYVCPSCDIDDGWSGTDSARETSWLPAPDTMPEELAPAQMVEVIYRSFSCRMPAYKVVWDLASEYRPLYSDSGLPLCSAEGLREDAKYVATTSTGVVRQFPNKPLPDVAQGRWVMGGVAASEAPESHRKPGDWRESLMEVMR